MGSQSDPLSVEAIVSQAMNLGKTAGNVTRTRLIDALRDASIALEDVQESTQRVLYSQYQLMAVRFGSDINLFNILEDAGKPLTVTELSSKTKTDPKLLSRFLRYMASVRLIHENDTDLFSANNVSKAFTNVGLKGGVYHYFDYLGRGMKHLPDYLRERDYQNPHDALNTATANGWGDSDILLFDHFQKHPELYQHFNHFMIYNRVGMPTWLSRYPYKEAATSLKSPDQVFFVDVGGGFGHQAIALREELPTLPNRIIVQDVPAVLEAASIKHPNVEVMTHDFWKPQPVTGAKFYYMRNIMHDYPDDRAVQILTQLKNVLGPDSVILIDEMYLGTKGQHWHAAQLDITMMLALAALERTEAQWQELISKAGLKIRKVYQYTDSLRDSIIECVPIERA